MTKRNLKTYENVDLSDHVVDETLKTRKLNSTIIKEGNGKKKSDKTQHYVDNEKFFRVLVGWQQECELAIAEDKPQPRIPEYIGECVMKIANRLATHPSFIRSYYKDEMALAAIENCIKKLKKFNPSKTANPFAYFTQICYFSFIGFIDKTEEAKYRHYKMILDSLGSGDLVNSPEHQSEMAEHVLDNVELQVDYLQDYVADYEKRVAKKKKDKEERNAIDLFGDTTTVATLDLLVTSDDINDINDITQENETDPAE